MHNFKNYYCILSVCFIYLDSGIFFCNSLTNYEYDSDLKKYVHTPGSVSKHRSEGFGSTDNGRFGIQGINDITFIHKHKIIVWGDSYVEAHQLDDKFKIPQRITEKLSERGIGDTAMAFGVGMSGDSVADYYAYIPKYEKLVRNIKAHYIVITGFADTLPVQLSESSRWDFRANPLRLTQNKWAPKYQSVKKKLNDLGLYFVWEPVKSTIDTVNHLQMIPHVFKKKPLTNLEKTEWSKSSRIQAWSFLFEKLKEQTEWPLIFVYCPHVPRISHGKIITTDANIKDTELFLEVAQKRGISVINLQDRFVNFYKTSGSLPRGFSNSTPGEGHMNRFGDDITAQAIIDHIFSKGIFN